MHGWRREVEVKALVEERDGGEGGGGGGEERQR